MEEVKCHTNGAVNYYYDHDGSRFELFLGAGAVFSNGALFCKFPAIASFDDIIEIGSRAIRSKHLKARYQVLMIHLFVNAPFSRVRTLACHSDDLVSNHTFG